MKHKDINIDKLCSRYESISLERLESLNLLNRIDTKFIIDTETLLSIFEGLINDHKILEIDGIRNFNYYNLYFDTNDFQFFNQHHNGKVHRSKVRYRHYIDVNKYYFEIKTKTSGSFTIKNRIKDNNIDSIIENKAADLLHDTLSINPCDLKPKLIDTYDRITLINEEHQEKITIDTNLYFKNTFKDFKLPGIALIEIKQKKQNFTSPSFSLLRELNFRPQKKLSKYCIGMVLTNTVDKYNRFKPTILKLNKSMSKENGFNFHEFSDN